MSRAIFFDRDGVLNKLVKRDGGYYSPQRFQDFILFDNVGYITSKLKEEGFYIIIVSNQPDISRGRLTTITLFKMTNKLKINANTDDILYCTHDDEDGCNCRKPKPGMIVESAKKWNINLNKSLMVGDTINDLKAAENANIKFILMNNIHNKNIICENRIDDLDQLLNKVKDD